MHKETGSETPKKYLQKLLNSALKDLGFPAVNLEITVPEPRFGDYSSNAALVLSKQLKKNPKELAAQIIEQVLKLDENKNLASATEAGGFINFSLAPQVYLQNLNKIIEQRDLYGCSIMGEGKTVVVEYFQNNVAKPPHVGHLRSAVIGDSLLRILRSQGYKAISDTHIGDWGVQFGILIYAYKTMGDKALIEKHPINELNKLYVAMSAKIKVDESLRDKGKQEFVKLEQGDTENRELWQWFVRVSLEDFEAYRKLLDVLRFDHNLGESFYEDKMPAVLEEFKSKGLVTVGESGEQYVDLEAYGLGRCILVKSDGATTYHMRDFATYIYRKEKFKFFKNIYVVDNRQAHHFKQLFKVLDLAGYPASQDSEHVDFGFMSLPEGAISTRKGTTISLQNLLDEGHKRALAIINEKNPELENKDAVAKLVALAAIKYFDLSHNRKSEIVFTWDKALSFEGNTGPYLQYTHARIHGIFRKLATDENLSLKDLISDSQITLALTAADSSILQKLIQFSDVVAQVSQDYLPNLLCNYLFELAQLFNFFYQGTPVLKEKDLELRKFRLRLVMGVAQIIDNGLNLLGIEAPEEM
jgi:arginyl-tRNA synthetase